MRNWLYLHKVMIDDALTKLDLNFSLRVESLYRENSVPILIFLLDRKGFMGWVCLSVCHASTAALGKPYV
jgi:hypothetical protein